MLLKLQEILETNNYVYLVDIASGLMKLILENLLLIDFYFLKIFLILIKIQSLTLSYITLSMSLGGF